MSRCDECVRCRDCHETAYCLSEPNPTPPCPHDAPLCGECLLGPEGCVLCKLAAEAEMHACGEYDPAADPFYNHLAPEPVDAIARDGGYSWDGTWHTRPKKEDSP